MSKFTLDQFKPGHDEFHRELIKRQLIFSCVNCISFLPKDNTCLKYKAKPPPTVIVFSCGEGWEGDLPF